jgi:hypothetical protein
MDTTLKRAIHISVLHAEASQNCNVSSVYDDNLMEIGESLSVFALNIDSV